MAEQTTVTFRTSTETKARLDKLAIAMRRSKSFLTNAAVEQFLAEEEAFIANHIENWVAERRATRELVELGMQLAEQGVSSIPAEDIHSWILAEDDTAPFPAETRTS